MYPMPVFQENEMCKKRDLCKLSTSEEVCNPSLGAFLFLRDTLIIFVSEASHVIGVTYNVRYSAYTVTWTLSKVITHSAPDSSTRTHVLHHEATFYIVIKKSGHFWYKGWIFILCFSSWSIPIWFNSFFEFLLFRINFDNVLFELLLV